MAAIGAYRVLLQKVHISLETFYKEILRLLAIHHGGMVGNHETKYALAVPTDFFRVVSCIEMWRY